MQDLFLSLCFPNKFLHRNKNRWRQRGCFKRDGLACHCPSVPSLISAWGSRIIQRATWWNTSWDDTLTHRAYLSPRQSAWRHAQYQKKNKIDKNQKRISRSNGKVCSRAGKFTRLPESILFLPLLFQTPKTVVLNHPRKQCLLQNLQSWYF